MHVFQCQQQLVANNPLEVQPLLGGKLLGHRRDSAPYRSPQNVRSTGVIFSYVLIPCGMCMQFFQLFGL